MRKKKNVMRNAQCDKNIWTISPRVFPYVKVSRSSILGERIRAIHALAHEPHAHSIAYSKTL